jgi:hypothetical protein
MRAAGSGRETATPESWRGPGRRRLARRDAVIAPITTPTRRRIQPPVCYDLRVGSTTRPRLADRLKELLAVYGRVALAIYVVLFVLVLGGFALAIGSGYEPEGTAANAGVLASAWVATKLTQPIRILATLALTPLVAYLLGRRRKTAEGPATPAGDPPEPPVDAPATSGPVAPRE